MSDYMFKLENHLTVPQGRVVADMQAAAAAANINLFLTGGAVRDMFGGFPIRELGFTIEGSAVQFAKKVAETHRAEFRMADEARKTAMVVFPGGASAEIGMARSERYAKPGSKPQISPATIHEHLLQRDFTINALALSLSRASRGLLIDPANGLSDLQQRELRTVNNHALYDHPVRLFRLLRFKVRLGFQVAERTQMQYQNAKEAGVAQNISAVDMMHEMRHLAAEPNIGDVLQLWEQEGLLRLVSPALSGPKLNIQAFAKLQKALQVLPFGIEIPIDEVALFFNLLAEKLTPKERAALVESLAMDKATVDSWQKLDARAVKLEKEVASSKLTKPSLVFQVLNKVPAEQVLLVLVKSTQRTVQDRIRNYFGKHLPLSQEVTDLQVIEAGGKMGTPKFEKMKADLIRKKLDARPKKPEPVPEPPPVVTPPAPVGRPRSPSFTTSHRP